MIEDDLDDDLPVLTYAQIGQGINRWLYDHEHEWCGFPMPLPNTRLIVEDNHPHAKRIADLQAALTDDEDYVAEQSVAAEGPFVWLVNTWRTTWRGVTGRVLIVRLPDGTTDWGFEPDLVTRNGYLFRVFDGADAWSVEAERRALDRLRTLIPERKWAQYFMVGGFVEPSTRSGLRYWFRRQRPTVVFRRAREADEELSILCALCLHPVAYYEHTWCGAMVPTDDVIAHLLMMRSDEHKFWGRANQHSAIDPEAGLL